MNFTLPTYISFPTSITVPSWLPLIALIVAVTSAIIAGLNFRRKSGLLLRGNFELSSGFVNHDHFVRSIVLENLKDRAITVFAIYLRIGYSYYIQIENFENKPLLLKAYESYQKEFGPIQYYYCNANRVNLNSLLANKKIKKRLILSTSSGKYNVPRQIQQWNPFGEFFKNHLTATVYPVTLVHKENYVGENIDYIVDIKLIDKSEQTILLSKNYYQFKRFAEFAFTEQSLASKHALESFFADQIATGKLSATSVSITETAVWKKTALSNVGKTLTLKNVRWGEYFFIGRLLTSIGRLKLKFSRWKVFRLG